MTEHECPRCGGSHFATREDDAGDYEACVNCGRRQDGLGHLEDRFF